MQKSISRILTTHAGSLPRRPRLVELQTQLSHGEAVSEEELAAEIEGSTLETLQAQVDAGIDIINNGEQARESFFTYVQHRMSGFDGVSQRPAFGDMVRYPGWLALKIPHYTSGVNLASAPQAQGPVQYINPQPLHDELGLFARLLENIDVAETFVTAPSPGIIAAAMQDMYYGDMDTYIDALADALRTEYEAICGAGHVLQLDCPDLAMERHTYFAEQPDQVFVEFVQKVVSAMERALAEVPQEQVRMHVCWGNYNGPHDLDVELYKILPSLVDARVGALMLSMANPRHAHEYKLLTPQALPEHMLIVAGVIDTTTNYVEHPQVVADRIVQVAQTLEDPTRVIAGTDCGFETAAGFRDVAEDVVWAKLAALSEGAALASQRLF